MRKKNKADPFERVSICGKSVEAMEKYISFQNKIKLDISKDRGLVLVYV